MNLTDYSASQTAEIRQALRDVMYYHLYAFEGADMSPKERIELIGRLLPYCLPKLSARDSDAPLNMEYDPLDGLM